MSYLEKLKTIDSLQKQINSHGKFSDDLKKKILYKFRLDWNYYSNSMEGNTLTMDETRDLIIKHHVTISGKPIKDIREMEGHDKVITEIMKIGKGEVRLSEKRIKDIHNSIMFEKDEVKKKKIGVWKPDQNYILNYKGERFDFTLPSEVPEHIHSLLNETNAIIDGLNMKKKNVEHPVTMALQFHLRYLTIHPFFDGNGRTGRILSNLLLISFGYPPFIIKTDEKDRYYRYLGDVQCYGEKPELLYEFLSDLIIRSQKIVLDAINDKDISGPEDFDKEIEMLQRMQKPKKVKIKKSKEVIQKVLKEVYFPLLAETDKHLAKLNKLFKSHSWTYFEEPKPPKHDIPMMPTYGSLRDIMNNLYGVTGNRDDSFHHFKAAYWLMQYNDEHDFSAEVSFKIHFSELSYKIEVFVGQPLTGGMMVKMFSQLIKSFTNDKTPFDEFKSYYLPDIEYGDKVLKEAITQWSAQASKHTLDFIKKTIAEKKTGKKK